jgi:cytochrome oxidase Cu insertion factor (SCO1/SenC/PrrC family)
MRKVAIFLVMLLAAASVMAQAPAASKPQPPPLAVKVGDAAPDFTLKVYDGKQMKDISLSEFRGKKNVILAFFVFAFTGG